MEQLESGFEGEDAMRGKFFQRRLKTASQGKGTKSPGASQHNRSQMSQSPVDGCISLTGQTSAPSFLVQSLQVPLR
jgi:hypothetical protein